MDNLNFNLESNSDSLSQKSKKWWFGLQKMPNFFITFFSTNHFKQNEIQ